MQNLRCKNPLNTLFSRRVKISDVMENSFILPIVYDNKTYNLNTKFVRLGYIYQFHIAIENSTLIFERDEEGHYRVIDTNPAGTKVDKEFLQAVISNLSKLHD